MARFIRWVGGVVGLDEFPEQTQVALSKLVPGSFMVIAVSVETQLYVKRLTETAFQLGLEASRDPRTASSPTIVSKKRASAYVPIADEPACR